VNADLHALAMLMMSGASMVLVAVVSAPAAWRGFSERGCEWLKKNL